MSKVSVFISQERDPYLNQALEETLFNTLSAKGQFIFLWKNADSVVMGKHQIPWAEFDVLKAFEEGINIVRRTSGGGAVYHDPGNLNFSFINWKNDLNIEENFSVLIQMLRKLGVEACVNERKDIIVGGYKISGSAYRYTKEKAIHHGTLLIKSDLLRLRRVLKPVFSDLVVSRAVKSVPSEVANLSDFIPIDESDVLEAFLRSLAKTLNCDPEVMYIDKNTFHETEDLLKLFSSRKWIFGNAPHFKLMIGRFVFSIADGIIRQIEPLSDSDKNPFMDFLDVTLDPVVFKHIMEISKKEGYHEERRSVETAFGNS